MRSGTRQGAMVRLVAGGVLAGTLVASLAARAQPTTESPEPAAPAVDFAAAAGLPAEMGRGRLEGDWLAIEVESTSFALAPLPPAPEYSCAGEWDSRRGRFWRIEEQPVVVQLDEAWSLWRYSSDGCVAHVPLDIPLAPPSATVLLVLEAQDEDAAGDVDFHPEPGVEHIELGLAALRVVSASGTELLREGIEMPFGEMRADLAIYRLADGRTVLDWDWWAAQESCCYLSHGNDARRAYRWGEGGEPELLASLSSYDNSESPEEIQDALPGWEHAVPAGHVCELAAPADELRRENGEGQRDERYLRDNGVIRRTAGWRNDAVTHVDMTTWCAVQERRETVSWSWSFEPTAGEPIVLAAYDSAGEVLTRRVWQYSRE